MTWAVAVTAMLGLATVAVTWLTARRARSGKIDDTPAETLWEVVRGELDSTRAELRAARAEATELRAELAASRAESAASRAENVEMRKESVALRTSNARLCRALIRAQKQPA